MSVPSPRADAEVSAPGHAWQSVPFFAALLAIGVGLGGAVALVDGATEGGDLSAYDPAVTAGFVGARSQLGTVVAQGFTFFGSTAALVPLTLGLLLLLGLRRRWVAAAAVATGMSLSLTLTVVLKNAIGRIRPPAVDVLGAINNGFAFPSGHTLNGTVFVALVTGLLWSRCRTRAGRLGTVAGGVVMTVGIGLSRVYLGYHWLTDVMAGWSLALAVLGVILLGLVLLHRALKVSSGLRGYF